MRLVALYFEDHFLFEEPQTINFGGKYFYAFQNQYTIERVPNEKFIDNFYNDKDDHNKTISLVSAIVGKNGSGKTSLLRSIIGLIHGKPASLSEYTAVYEAGNKTLITPTHILPEKTYDTNFKFGFLRAKSETIYFSPFLDFKEPLYGIDISLDRLIEEDLEGIDTMYEANNDIIPSRRLKSKNALRQLDFQYSPFSRDVRDVFDFPEFNKSRFTFTRHRIDMDDSNKKIKFWNTPMGFQSVLQYLFSKITNEADAINKNRPKGYSLVNLQKELLKNYILMDVLCLFIRQMEKRNDYLDEGVIDGGQLKFEELTKSKNAKDTLYLFLGLHSIRYHKSKKFKVLPVKSTKSFLDYLFNLIDGFRAKDDRDNEFFDWNSKSIYLSREETENMISRHDKFLLEVDKYYRGIKDREGDVVFSDSDRIDGLINFEPSDRSLSSGENALLNFYSRFYYFFKKKVFDLPIHKRRNNYFVFLDEADLGFHPRWKKHFVKSILSFFAHFFDSFGSKVQIIFTTHDPLTLSDILNYNIIYLDEHSGIRSVINQNKPLRSFGANISDLLADSFFVGNGLIGDFAKEKMDDTILWLRNLEDKDNSVYHERVIRNIDEPIVQKKLSEMFDEKMKKNISDELIKEQIAYLQRLLKRK